MLSLRGKQWAGNIIHFLLVTVVSSSLICSDCGWSCPTTHRHRQWTRCLPSADKQRVKRNSTSGRERCCNRGYCRTPAPFPAKRIQICLPGNNVWFRTVCTKLQFYYGVFKATRGYDTVLLTADHSPRPASFYYLNFQ